MHVMTRVLRGRRNVRKQDRPIKPCILFAWWAGDDDNPGLAQGRIWEGNPGPDAAQMPKYNQRAINGKKNNAVKKGLLVHVDSYRNGFVFGHFCLHVVPKLIDDKCRLNKIVKNVPAQKAMTPPSHEGISFYSFIHSLNRI